MSTKVVRETKVTEDGEVITATTYTTEWQDGPVFKTPWNHNRDQESLSTALVCRDPTKTQQHLAKDTDINVILAKFMQTGEMPIGATAPTYQNFEEEFDLQNQMVTASQVDEAWNALSPEVRNTLKNPETFASYVEHCLEVGDLEPLRALGLAKPTSPQPPAPNAAHGAPQADTGGSPAPAPASTAPSPGGAVT